MKRFAVFTACIGNYDNILQPEVVDDRFDYILFTDEVKERQKGVWQVRNVDYTNPDKTRVARYVKTHPTELLHQYEATLWLDANIQVISQYIYDRFVSLFESGIEVASVQHPERNCIYDEAYTVVSLNLPSPLEHDAVAVRWCHEIWKKGYPLNYGLFETNVLYRRNNKLMEGLNRLWWKCIDGYSKRDQLSFNYVLWRLGVASEYYLNRGEHATNSSHLTYVNHGDVSKRKFLELSFWELERLRLRYVTPSMEVQSRRQWKACYRAFCPITAQWLWGVFYGVLYSPRLIGNILRHRKNRLA